MPTRSRSQRVALGDVIESGVTLSNEPVTIDIPELVVSRLLIQANSGSGKSWLARRLLEQTFGLLQHLIIDIEGEFASLREKFDYVLVGAGGDTAIEPSRAAVLAERLLSLRVSAIMDLSELPHDSRIEFVRLFLDALVNAPKKLWHPALVMVDEAHQFCSQDDQAESGAAVIDLCTRGRKRGFCAVLATQRISKLHKDAAAECNNCLVGRATLDLDMKRSGDILGMRGKHARMVLRDLKPGEFFAFGPAMRPARLVKMKSGDVQTTHPKAGGRIRFRAPKPTEKIRKMLAQLGDLPTPTEEAAGLSTVDLKHQLRDARQKLARFERAGKHEEKKAAVVLDRHLVAAGKVAKAVREASELVTDGVKRLTHLAQAIGARPAGVGVEQVEIEGVTNDNQRRILLAIKRAPGAPSVRIGSIAHVAPRLSTFRVATLALKKANLIRGDRFGWFLTSLGEERTAHVPPDPTGPEAIEYFRKQLGVQTTARHVYDAIVKAGNRGASYEDIERETGAEFRNSTTRVAVARIKDMGIIDVAGRGQFARFTLKRQYQ